MSSATNTSPAPQASSTRNIQGIDAATQAHLTRIFSAYPAIEQVMLYGSRAKGTAHERSDIDLVAYGKTLDRFIIARVLLDLDDSPIPYHIDLQAFHELNNPSLIAHIERVGVIIYLSEPLDNTKQPNQHAHE